MPAIDVQQCTLRVLWVLFVIAVPLFLITASVTWAINDAGLYDRGFQKYDISRHTGIAEADLRQAGADIRRYFNSGNEPLAVRARVYGEEREIFSQREVAHMRDVKGLIRGVYVFAGTSLVYILAVVIGGLAGSGRIFLSQLAGLLLRGGLLTLVLLIVFGLFALTGFDALFLAFHRFSFSNDLWQLDPLRDYLLIMFPFGFWFDATVRVAAAAIVGAVVLSATSGAYLLYRRWGRA